MSRSSPFDPKVVLGLVAVGAAAFLLFLYALGSGWTGGERSSGSGHAASKAINGYAALVALLEREGHDVALSRTPGRLDEESLLVLTPTQYADAEELAPLLTARRLQGPTLLILPKWFGFEASNFGLKNTPKDWVVLLDDAESPEWADNVGLDPLDVKIARQANWRAGDDNGRLPLPAQVQSIRSAEMVPLVEGATGRALVAWRDDGGAYEILSEWTGRAMPELDEDADNPWPLIVVAEPDLVNNAGLADARRARLAVDLVEAALDGYRLPVVFDLTLPGLARSENLLTLAFEPPFLAVTLTLLLAALVIGWRGFVRFGPPRADEPALAGGKAQLARDGAAMIERARRMRLAGPPYAALLMRRIGQALGLSDRLEPEVREASIARSLERRGMDAAAASRAAATLVEAHRPAEILRAAQALKSIERTISR
ncbi:DUF4350 domain-containing protein [Tsuneonella sp. HG222]